MFSASDMEQFKRSCDTPLSSDGVDLTKPGALKAWAKARIRELKGQDMAMLPQDAKARKDMPIARGVLDYFPAAIAAVAEVSRIGNEQHNPGQPMHWAKGKSTDHADCIVRHLIERGTLDTDGVRHSAKVAWRALALLQTEIDEESNGQMKVRRPEVMLDPEVVERMNKEFLEGV